MCEKGKGEGEKKRSFVYLQCSSGKLSPERREEGNTFKDSRGTFSSRGNFSLDTVLLNKTTL